MHSSSFIALAILASPALAAVYTTAPIASTSWEAGKEQTISWDDNDTAPKAAEFGLSKVGIYVGNAKQQTLLQSITDSVDVATTKSIKFTPSASIGPNGDDYFIRYESLNLKDATEPQYPALAFSAKFTLTGMSGTFNSSVQAQIDGASTAPVAGATGSASGSASATGSASLTGSASASGSASATGSASSKSSSASSSASRSASASASSASAGADNGARATAVGVSVVFGAVLSAIAALM